MSLLPNYSYLAQEFEAHVTDMPSCILQDRFDESRQWRTSYNPLGGTITTEFTGTDESYTYTAAEAAKFIFFSGFLVDGMPGDEWLWSWVNHPKINTSEVEDLL